MRAFQSNLPNTCYGNKTLVKLLECLNIFFKCKKKQKYQSQKRTHGEFAPVKGTFVFKKTDEQSCLLQHWQAPTATHAFLFLLIHVFTWLWWGLLFHVFKNVLYKMFIRQIFVPVEYVILLHFFLKQKYYKLQFYWWSFQYFKK